MKFLFKFLLMAVIAFQVACSADTADAGEKSDAAKSTSASSIKAEEVSLDVVKANVQAVFIKINPRFQVLSAQKSGIPGFYQVQISQGPSIYVNADASHFFTGEAFVVDNDQFVNLTEQSMNSQRLAVMKELNESDMLVFDTKKPLKRQAQITVFTDVDCFYCQKLHKEVPQLNEMGVAVRYMAFPRAGVGSDSYKKIVSAWCADDPQTSMTMLKNRQKIKEVTCDNPVEAQYKLGQSLGVTGTPAILLDDGSLIPGYRPAKDLAKLLGVSPK